MTKITLYDLEAERITDLADEFDTVPCEIVSAMFDALDEHNIDISAPLRRALRRSAI